MKKIAFVCVLLAVLFSFVPAKAMETKTYSGTVGSNPPYLLDFTTYRVGSMTVNIVWTPKRNSNYIMQVFHYTDPLNPYNTTDYLCYYSTYTYLQSPHPGNWTCSIPNAYTGFWRVYFRSYNGGQVAFNLSVTAETNP